MPRLSIMTTKAAKTDRCKISITIKVGRTRQKAEVIALVIMTNRVSPEPFRVPPSTMVNESIIRATAMKTRIPIAMSMMTGVAISSGGATTPFFKAGFTPNALSQSVEIGDETNPNGFLFLVTGVLFSLGEVGEGAYSIELGF